MISDEIAKGIYASLQADEKLKLALYNDFGEEAQTVYDFIKSPVKDNEQIKINIQQTEGSHQAILNDGVYYIYEDGSVELFDFKKRNAPTKAVQRIGVVMGSHALAVNLEDYPEQPLTNQKDRGNYSGYISEYDDAVADWNGKANTEHIKSIGTGIELKDDEWIPSVAELYLIYLNKRSINAAIELSGGSRIKDGWYWTSTENSATDAWLLYLSPGYLGSWDAKVTHSRYVRAVAAFH
ncbi:MAG: DUF1566 domain-containing protein [Bacteroidales bacterium]|nr:DUF1566 domain-containing protein [Bacteroidales bacterium]